MTTSSRYKLLQINSSTVTLLFLDMVYTSAKGDYSGQYQPMSTNVTQDQEGKRPNPGVAL